MTALGNQKTPSNSMEDENPDMGQENAKRKEQEATGPVFRASQAWQAGRFNSFEKWSVLSYSCGERAEQEVHLYC